MVCIAPLIHLLLGSMTDTFLFFSIAFYATGIPWITLAFGDLVVKLIIAIAMLIPFRLLLIKLKIIQKTQHLILNFNEEFFYFFNK